MDRPITLLNEAEETIRASGPAQRGALDTRARHSEKPLEKIDMKLDSTPTAQMRALELSYTERVNMAVAEDRDDLVAELAAEFEVELQLLQPARAA
jgi:hypothetical protein